VRVCTLWRIWSYAPCSDFRTVGAPIAGRLSDRVVVGWREKRNGRWVPEDRLRAALPGALVLLPLSVMLSGVFTHYVAGTTGLMLNMGCLFVSGIGVRTAQLPPREHLTAADQIDM